MKQKPLWMALAICAIVYGVTGLLLLMLAFSGFIYFFSAVGIYYNIATIVYPAVMAAIAALLLARRKWRPAATLLICASLAAFCLRIYATNIEPNRLVLREVTIESEKIKQPIRLLHITDIQSGAVGAHDERAIAMMRELHPDIIIHTGDLLHPVRPATYGSERPKLDRLLRELDPPHGFFNVIGDVDGWLGRQPGSDFGGMTTLMNDEWSVEINGSKTHLLGLSIDASRDRAKALAELTNVMQSATPDEFLIVFGHAPDFVLEAQNFPIDLCLAGHTHGGQIRLPLFGPLITKSEVPRDLARGFHKVGQTRLNVSAGIGAEHAAGIPAIRFDCPPEMTLITLVPK